MSTFPCPFAYLTLLPPPSQRSKLRHDPDIEFLRDSRVESGYACVYTTDHKRYRARVLKRINIDSYHTAQDAARAVVEWYRWWYGTEPGSGGCPKWLLAFYSRKANPWRTRKVNRGGMMGYIVDVFYHNQPIRVTRKTWRFPNAKTPRWYRKSTPREREIADCDFWYTRADAVDAAKKVIYRRMRSELGFVGMNVLQLFWRGRDRRKRYATVQGTSF